MINFNVSREIFYPERTGKKKKRRKCAKPSGGASMKEPRKCLAEEKGKDQWSSWKRTSGCLVRLVRQG